MNNLKAGEGRVNSVGKEAELVQLVVAAVSSSGEIGTIEGGAGRRCHRSRPHLAAKRRPG